MWKLQTQGSRIYLQVLFYWVFLRRTAEGKETKESPEQHTPKIPAHFLDFFLIQSKGFQLLGEEQKMLPTQGQSQRHCLWERMERQPATGEG